jgi:hypothetical protein
VSLTGAPRPSPNTPAARAMRPSNKRTAIVLIPWVACDAPQNPVPSRFGSPSRLNARVTGSPGCSRARFHQAIRRSPRMMRLTAKRRTLSIPIINNTFTLAPRNKYCCLRGKYSSTPCEY